MLALLLLALVPQDPPVVLALSPLERALPDEQDAHLRDVLTLVGEKLARTVEEDEDMRQVFALSSTTDPRWSGPSEIPPAFAMALDLRGLMRAAGGGDPGFALRPRTLELALARQEGRYSMRMRLAGGRLQVEETLDPAVLRVVPQDAAWAQAWLIDGALIADAARLLGLLEGDGPWLQALLGSVRLTYAVPSAAGLATVQVLQPAPAEDGSITEVWAEIPARLRELEREDLGVALRVESSEANGVAMLAISVEAPRLAFEFFAVHDESRIYVAAGPEEALNARAVAIGGGEGLLERPELRAIADTPGENLVGLNWFDAGGLLRFGHQAARRALSMSGASVSDFLEALPGRGELGAGESSWIWVTRGRGADLVVDAELDRSMTRSIVVFFGYLASEPYFGALLGLLQVNVDRATKASRRTVVLADLRDLDLAVVTFALRNNGRFPQSLEDLVTPDEYGHAYIKSKTVPLDPWSRPYRYDPPAEGPDDYRIYTLGADGEVGGEGEDADVSTEDRKRP